MYLMFHSFSCSFNLDKSFVVKKSATVVESKLRDLDLKLDENRRNFEVCKIF